MGMEITELRTKLVERMRREASYVQSETHDDRLQKLVMVSQAILAVDMVMKAGGTIEPDNDGPLAMFIPNG